MKNKMIKFGIISCAAMMAVGTALAVSRVGINNTRLADTITYTITLNDANSPASESVSCPSTYEIETELGNEITFSYTNCTGGYFNHAMMEEGGIIKNVDAITGMESFLVLTNGTIQYRSSSDGTSWSSYISVTSGETTEVAEGSNYIEFSTATGGSFSAVINYSCEAGETPTKYNPANYYDGYYSEIVSWTDGEDLKEQLHTVISRDKNSLTYLDENWDSNTDADHVQDNCLELDAIYTDENVKASLTNRGWQREHAWCASLMTGSTTGNAVKCLGRATDFHNLFAGGAAGNMSRGNKNFGNVSEGIGTIQDKGSYKYNSGDTGNFEPTDNDKGRVARAIFYMATMYTEEEYDDKNKVTMKGLEVVDNYVGFIEGNDCKFQIGNKQALLAWNNSVPVDRLEMQHNVSVQTHEHNGVAQNNRNPYVDYPGLVDYVFGSKKEQAGRLEDIKPSAVDLGYDNDTADDFRYYTVTSAPNSYGVGNTFDSSEILISVVHKDFTTTTYEDAFTTSLDGHTFAEAEEGTTFYNQVTIGEETIQYPVVVEGMTTCSFYQVLTLAGTGLTTAAMTDPQEITIGEDKWTASLSGGTGLALSNVNKTLEDGTKVPDAFKGGSTTSGKNFSSLTFVSTEDYKVDKFYLSLTPGNKSSGYTIKFYIDDELIKSQSVVYVDGKSYQDYGGAVGGVKEGKLKVVVTGNNALIVHAIAFNVVE